MLERTRVLPKAREDKLLVQAVGDELVVYDEERHRAHRLNQATALVWHQCDGQTTISEMAEILQGQLHLPADEEVVWLALSQLEQGHLLQERVMRPPDVAIVSRRGLMQKLGLAAGFALVLPGIETIVAPTRAMAQNVGDGDNGDQPECAYEFCGPTVCRELQLCRVSGGPPCPAIICANRARIS